MNKIDIGSIDPSFNDGVRFTSFEESSLGLTDKRVTITAGRIYNDIEIFVRNNPNIKEQNIIRILDKVGTEFEISEIYKERFGSKEIVLNFKDETGKSENLKGRISYRTPDETQKLQLSINYYIGLLAEQRKKEKEFIAKNSREGTLTKNHKYNQFTDKTPLQEAVTRIQKQTIEFLQKSQTQKRSIEQERSLKNQFDDADILKERALEKGLNVRRIVRVKTEST